MTKFSPHDDNTRFYGMPQYDVFAYWVCHIMTFVAYEVQRYVAYEVCRSAVFFRIRIKLFF